jgi:phosphoribosylamine--glycine ligase
MRVLVIGSGGREHALAWSLQQSPRVSELVCAPGNAGMAGIAECVPADVASVEALVELGAKLRPELTVVGPEVPLSLGVVDAFEERGWKIFGPRKDAAQLEASKAFAKQFMVRHNIPTAHYAMCSSAAEVRDALAHLHAPVVVKADGLAAGKGVVIAQSKEEAEQVANEMLAGTLVGEAGRRVLLEEFLEGEELSFLVMSDGERVAPLAAARDHKRVGDGDTGPNTGGMGAYSADELLDEHMRDWLLHHLAQPVVAGMKAEAMEYRGVLYCGLMMTAREPMVLEFNCRFGDPETQPIMMRLESDLSEALEESAHGHLSEGVLRWSKDAACCVVLASGGYPGKYETGKPITGLQEAGALEGVQIFHAGTAMRDGQVVTAGGRVLNVCARGRDLRQALQRAYAAAAVIHFDGMHYRRDIGKSAQSEPQRTQRITKEN